MPDRPNDLHVVNIDAVGMFTEPDELLFLGTAEEPVASNCVVKTMIAHDIANDAETPTVEPALFGRRCVKSQTDKRKGDEGQWL